jgi:plastocyanin
MNLRTAPLALVAALALGACGGGDPGSDGAATTAAPAISNATSDATGSSTADATTDATADTAGPARIVISRSRFDNVELRVAPGTTVVFENTDAFAHTITSTDASPIPFDSGDLGQDETFEFTFDEVGEYPYFCQIHPTMRAVVIVG